jgi:hypothetical protein
VPNEHPEGLSGFSRAGLFFGGCTIVVYNGAMATTKQVRRSVTLPAPVAKQVESLASRRRLSENRALVELIELGIEASKQKEKAFFELAERFRTSKDPAESKRLSDEIGRFLFGDATFHTVSYSAAPLKRTISECLALLPKTSTAVIDPDFAKDVEAAVESHREPLEPPAWD